MTSRKKPHLSELIETFSQQGTDTALIDRNARILRASTVNDYDQNNFKKVISSIELNGLTHFNMTTFWGKITPSLEEMLTENSMAVHELQLHYSSSSNPANSLDQFTSAFNCDSVGCIAGFAMAEAMNWQQPKWMVEDSRNYMMAFEHIACNFLNIPLEVGRRIFYGDSGSVWAFVRFYENRQYSDIQWENALDDLCEEECDYDEQWENENIVLSSIDYKVAVDVLQRIVQGEIIFSKNNDFLPEYSVGSHAKIN